MLFDQAVLAAVIMTAVIFSVEHHVIHPIWNSKSKNLSWLSGSHAP